MKQQSIYLDGLGHGKTPIPLACKVGGLLISSGIGGRSRATGELADSFEGQLEGCFDNLLAILDQAGMGVGNVAKLSFTVGSDDARDAINDIWLRHFPDPMVRPARHVQQGQLRGKLLVQIEAMAFAG